MKFTSQSCSVEMQINDDHFQQGVIVAWGSLLEPCISYTGSHQDIYDAWNEVEWWADELAEISHAS